MRPVTVEETKNLPPVFIVGLPRSGTTLLAAMLSAGSEIDCGPETHFFTKLTPKLTKKLTSKQHWPKHAIDYVLDLQLNGQGVCQLFGLDKKEVERFLSRQAPSLASIIKSLTVQHARNNGKTRWLEKTPNHLLHLDIIRKTFPDAVIIRIIRDPRACALSMQNLPWASPSPLANILQCSNWLDQSSSFFTGDPRSLTIRYEDLLANPAKQSKRLSNPIYPAS